MAFPWLATLITRDPVLISLVAFATRLPWLLFSIPAGVWTDRADRRQLMIRADLIRMLLTGGVIAVIFSAPDFPVTDPLPLIFGLCTLAFLLGSAEVVRDNAAQTVLPQLVPKDALEGANGQLWSIEQIMGAFVGPPLAGLLIAYSVPAPFVLDAVTFGVAAGLVWCIRLPLPKTAPKIRASWTNDMRDGIRWLRAHGEILQLAIMLGIMNLLSIMALTMLPLFGQELFGLDPFQYGLLLTVEAAGGVVGGLISPAIARRLGGRPSLLLALPVMAACWVLVAAAPAIWIVGLALFAGMFAALLWNVVTVSYRQRHIPDELLGRVNSLYRFFGWGMLPFGALLGGIIVALAEPEMGRALALRLPYAMAALGMGVISIYAAARLKL